MKIIQLFLDDLFKKEQKTIDAGNSKNRFDEYNMLAAELELSMNNITLEHKILAPVGFGLPVLSEPSPDFFYDEDDPYPPIRHLYKITEYDNQKYGKLWACYVSTAEPVIGLTKSIASCFIVAQIEGKLKITAQFNPDYSTNRWMNRGGDDELKHYKLGKLIKIERLMTPVNDDWSIKEYNKEK